MGLFDNMFGGGSNATNADFWKELKNEADLEDALQESENSKIAIFKHSTRCHISKTVLARFENEVKNSDQKITCYFLDLISHRDLSNLISSTLNVTHQSPQLLIVENRIATNHSSHSDITL